MKSNKLNKQKVLSDITKEYSAKSITKKSKTIADPELEKIIYHVAKLTEDKKAIDTEILDVRDLVDIADYVIITSGSSKAQLKAISEHIETELEKLNIKPGHKEGRYGDKWFLLDYIDFVVHIVDEEARQFYNLEELWSHAFFVPRDEWI